MAHVKTYARLKPTTKPYHGFKVKKNTLTIHLPDSKEFMTPQQQQQQQQQQLLQNQQVSRSNISYDIKFSGIFQPESTQEEVFDRVAKDIIKNFLNGYNGTIFAYGQTGTGKTYTVEGNSRHYKARGLATRALSMIYKQLQGRVDEEIYVYLSYLEIYQEVAFDLLNPATRTAMPMAPFSKVTVVEGPHGSCILRGLSLHLAATEEIAQMLLLQGQVNRKVAETPVNQQSSRSHAVFTVYLQVRQKDSEIMLTSKLHLVDLAGSERVSKTGVDGHQLTEAKSINLSLHHLESVIIALQLDRAASGGSGRGDVFPSNSRSNTSHSESRSSKYVPYRNSLLTMVLKDSLGGNCLTAMIATISLELENMGESISTCRFAQRVARIHNQARRNEEIDDKTLIKRLKKKVSELEKQVALLRSKGSTGESMISVRLIEALTEEDRLACSDIMEGYMSGLILDPVSAGISNQTRFREFLDLLKHRYIHIEHNFLANVEEPASTSTAAPLQRHHDSGDHTVVGRGTTDMSVKQSNTCMADECSGALESKVTTVNSLTGLVEKPKKTKAEKQTTDPQPSDLEKQPKTIEELLQGLQPKDKYKSPFERRREKEIKKMSQRVTSLEEQQAAKKGQLDQLREDGVMDELLMAENSFQLKLQVAEEQVADQHAYILQLKHMNSDPELINKEKLVEHQLVKRQMRFQKKLEEIDKVKAELIATAQAKFDGVGPANHQKEKSAMTLEEKFGCYKQGKTLNTREVFEMLHREEKKQKKESEKLDREKTVIKAKQLAKKEEATLDKLRELKQMLKLSQQKDEQPQAWSQSPTSETLTEAQPPHQVASSPQLKRQAMNALASEVSQTADWSEPLERRNVVSSKINNDHNASESEEVDTLNQNPRFEKCKSVQASCFLLGQSNFYEPHESNKFTQSYGESKVKPTNSKNYNNNADECVNSSTELQAHSTENVVPSQIALSKHADIGDGYSKSSHSMNGEMFLNGQEKTSVLSPVSSHSSDFGKDTRNGEQSANYMFNSEVRFMSTRRQSSSKPDIFPVLTPSEYVYSMSQEEKFDARRMGLGSRTFESALSHMLDRDSTSTNTSSFSTVHTQGSPMANDNEDLYESYACTTQSSMHVRHAKHRHGSDRAKASSGEDSQKARRRRKGAPSPSRHTPDARTTWGPNLKHISVAERLDGLLDTPSSFLPEENNADFVRHHSKGKHLSNKETFDSKMAQYRQEENRSNVLVGKEEDEENAFFGTQPETTKITALSEEEGERTYMTRVQLEKERVAKIRKARQAAELIQRRWRRFKAAQ